MSEADAEADPEQDADGDEEAGAEEPRADAASREPRADAASREPRADAASREPRADAASREPRADDRNRGRSGNRDGGRDRGGDRNRDRRGGGDRDRGGDRQPVSADRAPIEPPAHAHDDDDAPEPAAEWGRDDEPAQPIVLKDDMPADAPADDPDPLTWPLLEAPTAQLGEDVANVIGVRFVAAGRVQWCDAGNGDYEIGERVLVDSDRGQRVATVATAAQRRGVRDRNLRRVIRRAGEQEQRPDDTGTRDALRAAKDIAARLKLPLKVSRVENSGGGRMVVYYSSDEQRLDLRDFMRDLTAVPAARGARVELRQLGARDEAKIIGGIGSCGLTLCCTTWLPEFVPVSIKMAKDQGLVLSPTKVAGQCGRLKCCLVYEQAAYAELRKGLPKLGKRVISQRGEGRVVEVDVLRQRIRVAYAPGDSEVLPAGEVKPMFPSQHAEHAEPEE